MYLRGKDFDRSKVIAPLAFGYLAAYLKEYLNFTDIVIETENAENLLHQSVDIVGISSFSETFEDVIRISRHFKSVAPDMPIILGGEHISAIPQTLPKTVDIGVLGEGEETLMELMQLYLRNEATFENLEKVKGLIYWKDGEQCITAPRPWIEDMDSIPMPNRMLLQEVDVNWQQPIFTARGCPYKCTFCASTKFWQKTRYHSVARVIEEIEYIVAHFPNQTNIPINDDLFPLNKQRMRAIVEAIRSKGLHRKTAFVLNARASVFDEEIAELVAAMNTVIVCFGFESASDKILTSIKGKTSAQENLRALELCERHGLSVVGSFMAGAPEEDHGDMAKTYWFIQKNLDRLWYPSVCLATPFPGTEFWWDAEKQGLISEDFQRWNILDLCFDKDESIYLNKHIPLDEFEPMYNQGRNFQGHPIKTREDYVQNITKRYYQQFINEKIAREFDGADSILEVGFEHSKLPEYMHSDLTQLFITDGAIQTEDLDETYDLVILNHALEKARQPEQMLQQVLPLLKPEGQLVCLCYNASHMSFLLELLRGYWEPGIFSINHRHALRFFTPDSLQNLLQEQQLQISRIEHFNLPNDIFEANYKQLVSAVKQAMNLEENLEKYADSFSSIMVAQKTPSLDDSSHLHIAEQKTRISLHALKL